MIYNEQILHPLALVSLIITGLFIYLLPRKYVLVPFLFAVVFIPVQQRILFVDIDLDTLRMLTIIGLLRIVTKKEFRGFQPNMIDLLFIAWQITSIVSYALLWQDIDHAFSGIAIAFTAIGLYAIMRILITIHFDIIPIIYATATICIILTGFVFYEYWLGYNPFHIFGVREISRLREDFFRIQGPFRHPNTLGLFATTAIPLMITQFNGHYLKRAFLLTGILCAIFVVINTVSSTAVGALILTFLLLCAYPFRKYTKPVVYTILASLAGIQIYWLIFKQKPIWALILKGQVFSESTAYHRFFLFDKFVKNTWEWFVWGVKTSAHWAPPYMNTFDQSNQFVYIGAHSGIFPLIIFISLLVFAFKTISNNLALFTNNHKLQFYHWSLGVMLSTHIAAFWGVPYYDQIIVFFFLHIAIIANSAEINTLISKSIFHMQWHKNSTINTQNQSMNSI